MFAHLLNIVGVLGPLILWLVTRDRGGLADSEGKEATNWGITVVIAGAAIGVLNVIVTFIIPPLAFVVVFAGFALSILNIVFAIMGGVQVNSTGRPYRYPWTFRFIA
nr:DUF4870 domain-containing protein [Pseudoclavibacter chungangensis]